MDIDAELEWRNDAWGHERRALYLGGLYVGEIHASFCNPRTPWRGLFMIDNDGEETGHFETEDDARLSVEAAFNAAVGRKHEREVL